MCRAVQVHTRPSAWTGGTGEQGNIWAIPGKMGCVSPSVSGGSAGALSTSRAEGEQGRAADGRDNCEVLMCQPSRTRGRGNDSENDELV